MKLLGLPNELLLHIALFLDHPKHLFSLLRANRHLSILLPPALKRLAETHTSSTIIQIFWTAITRNSEALQSLLETGAKVTISNKSGSTLHEVPGRGGNIDQIIAQAATISICRNEGTYRRYTGSGLHWAIKTGGGKLLKLLLNGGADIENTDSELKTPLDLAASIGNAELVRVLLEKGADRSSRARFGCTPLHRARDKAHMEAFRALLEENGAAIRYKDGAHLIHVVAAHPFGDDVDAIQMLLQRGAKVTDKDDLGQTALHFAAGAGNRKIVQLLLEEGADVNYVGKTSSVISLACKGGHIEVAKILFDKASLSFRDNKKMTPLHLAIEHLNYDDVVPLLLRKGFSVDVRDASGATPLRLAVFAGKIDVAELLIEYGADVNAVDSTSQTALHLVATREIRKNEYSITRLLLDSGADVNTQDADGMTALHYAVSKGKERLINLLMGARPDGLGNLVI